VSAFKQAFLVQKSANAPLGSFSPYNTSHNVGFLSHDKLIKAARYETDSSQENAHFNSVKLMLASDKEQLRGLLEEKDSFFASMPSFNNLRKGIPLSNQFLD
jgi:hypothetical protein